MISPTLLNKVIIFAYKNELTFCYYPHKKSRPTFILSFGRKKCDWIWWIGKYKDSTIRYDYADFIPLGD